MLFVYTLLLFLQCASEIWALPSPAPLRGAALASPQELYTWGEHGAFRWDLSKRTARQIRQGSFTAGGCFTPSYGLVLQDSEHKLTADGREIDTNIHLSDCLEAELLGHKGILLIHRNAQLRFYEPAPSGRWPYTEIYSIYTASAQTGLLLEDIDGDGRKDIYCGNYWLQSPAAFELPWRIFAMHPHYKEPLSSSLLIAKAFGGVVEAQREFEIPMFSVFRKPGNASELWMETPLGARVRRPQALVPTNKGIVVGEDVGRESRLLWIRSPQDKGVTIGRPNAGIIAAFAIGGNRILAVTRERVHTYSLRVQ